jgi:multidrug efflux pump subunit AcrA (membrane-fusion protein)
MVPTLIYGSRDVVLVDDFITTHRSNAPADVTASKCKNLKTIAGHSMRSHLRPWQVAWTTAGAARYVCIAAALLCFAGCGTHEATASHSQPRSIDVRVARPKHVRIAGVVDLSGTVETPSEPTNVAFLVSGKVVRVGPREGDFVRAGDILAVVDPTDFQLALDSAAAQTAVARAKLEKASVPARPEVVEQARASLSLAENELRRMRLLYDRKSLAQNDFERYQTTFTNAQQQYEQAKQGAQKEDKDAARASWEQAQAAERIARKRLSDATLTAPVSGFIAKRNIERGAVAATSLTAFTIVQLDPVEIRVGIPETDISMVHHGQHAIATASALPGVQFLGNVRLISVSAEPETRTYMARITVPNRENKLLVGMIAEVRIMNDADTDVLTLPATSIMLDPRGATFVYVYFPNDKRVYAKRVTAGAITRQDIQIVDGINDSDLIVIAGQQLVREGSTVSPTEAHP